MFWKLGGKTLDSNIDNIVGKIDIIWILDGFFLQLMGKISIADFTVKSLEIVSYDSTNDIFLLQVFSSLSEKSAQYYWYVEGDLVTYWT